MMDLRDEQGSVALWMLGLGFMLLTLGGLSIDLWNLVGERAEVAALADSAATAGATVIDEVHFRQTGEVLIDPDPAQERALALLAAQPGGQNLLVGSDWFTVSEDRTTVSVVLRRDVGLALLRLSGRDTVTVGATGLATAVVAP